MPKRRVNNSAIIREILKESMVPRRAYQINHIYSIVVEHERANEIKSVSMRKLIFNEIMNDRSFKRSEKRGYWSWEEK